MKVDVVRPRELGRPEVDAWRAMQAGQATLASPFLSAGFARMTDEVRDDARVAVLSDGPDIIGFFPFERHGLGIGKPIAGWLTLCQGIVHQNGVQIDVDQLLRRCSLHVWEYEHLVAGQPWFAPYTALEVDGAVMDLREGYETYLEQVRQESPRTIKMGLYRLRKLGRDIGPVTFDPDVRDLEELRLLMRWKSDQYRRIGRPDRFARPWVVELVERLFAGREERCAGALSMLYADGKPIAGHFGLRSEGYLAGWFPAYDPAFAKYSPGLLQHLKMLEAAAASGVTTVDWGPIGGMDYKLSLRNASQPLTEGIASRRTLGAAVHSGRRSSIRKVRQFILDSPRLHEAADKIMRRYGSSRKKGTQ